MKIRKWLALILIATLLPACSPSQSAVQTAIAQTQSALIPPTAASTSTPIPTPTYTPAPTFTPTLTASPEPTITPTPDVQIIDTDPQKLLCTVQDLPEEGKYYIPNEYWMSINTNEEVISTRGVEKGRDYVISTGRVTGWWAARVRGTRAARMPEQLTCGVYLFKTAEGARLAMTKYNSVEAYPEDGWKYLVVPMDLGDTNIVYARYEIDSGGDKNTGYEIQFTYRNIMVSVFAYAKKEEDVPHAVLEAVARRILEKLVALPLVDPADAVLAK